MPERSRVQDGPRHLAEGGSLPSLWRSIDPRRLAVAVGMTLLAVPVLVVDNLSSGTDRAEAVETAGPASAPPTSTSSTTLPPTTVVVTVPPTTVPPTTAPPTTVAAAAVTAPPTTRPRATTTTVPPTTVPPTTAPPAPPSVEETIRAVFGAAGDQAVAVARCESDLNPSAQSPAGYRGLFQLSPEHAEAFRRVTGRSFDDAWDEAGPNSQFAKYLYDRQGWAPWGSCGDRAG